eukprot:RCo042527
MGIYLPCNQGQAGRVLGAEQTPACRRRAVEEGRGHPTHHLAVHSQRGGDLLHSRHHRCADLCGGPRGHSSDSSKDLHGLLQGLAQMEEVLPGPQQVAHQRGVGVQPALGLAALLGRGRDLLLLLRGLARGLRGQRKGLQGPQASLEVPAQQHGAVDLQQLRPLLHQGEEQALAVAQSLGDLALPKVLVRGQRGVPHGTKVAEAAIEVAVCGAEDLSAKGCGAVGQRGQGLGLEHAGPGVGDPDRFGQGVSQPQVPQTVQQGLHCTHLRRAGLGQALQDCGAVDDDVDQLVELRGVVGAQRGQGAGGTTTAAGGGLSLGRDFVHHLPKASHVDLPFQLQRALRLELRPLPLAGLPSRLSRLSLGALLARLSRLNPLSGLGGRRATQLAVLLSLQDLPHGLPQHLVKPLDGLANHFVALPGAGLELEVVRAVPAVDLNEVLEVLPHRAQP